MIVNEMFKGRYNVNSKSEITLNLSVIEYKKDDLNYIKCPALGILVYGFTKEKAIESLDYQISEFLNYTFEKNTLEKVLNDLQTSYILIKNNE